MHDQSHSLQRVHRRVTNPGIAIEPTFREPARIVVEYPAEAGRTWQHYSLEDELDLVSTREVVGLETVTTPAGTFPCVIIRTRLFFGRAEDDTIDWFDAIASVGLVRRTIAYRQQAYSPEGTDLGPLVTTQTETLVAAE